ncbi:hypothetical protein KCA24_33625 [Escherichia coli]|nr:hypothetical protein [Escherichia coli]
MNPISTGGIGGFVRETKVRQTIHPAYVHNQQSRSDFFTIFRKAYQNDQSIRVYMTDGREIEVVSRGVDACQVTLKLEDGGKILVFSVGVNRTFPF